MIYGIWPLGKRQPVTIVNPDLIMWLYEKMKPRLCVWDTDWRNIEPEYMGPWDFFKNERARWGLIAVRFFEDSLDTSIKPRELTFWDFVRALGLERAVRAGVDWENGHYGKAHHAIKCEDVIQQSLKATVNKNHLKKWKFKGMLLEAKAAGAGMRAMHKAFLTARGRALLQLHGYNFPTHPYTTVTGKRAPWWQWCWEWLKERIKKWLRRK